MSEAGEVRRRWASRTSRRQKDDEEYIGRELHSIKRQIVGKVQYITPRRPDVMFALKEAARHLQEPRWFDWYRLGRLVRYLCDTGSYAMHLQHSGDTGGGHRL